MGLSARPLGSQQIYDLGVEAGQSFDQIERAIGCRRNASRIWRIVILIVGILRQPGRGLRNED